MKKLNDPFSPTPEGFHLRVEQTLNGLEEREMTRRKFSVSLAFVLALVMIMTVAAVAGVTGGYVGWDGIIHYYEDADATHEPVDEASLEERIAVKETYNKYLQTVPRGECWIITKDGEEITGTNCPDNIWDEETFLALIEGTDLPVPVLPGGYQLLAVSTLTEPEDTPYEEVTLDDGAVLSKYKLKAPVAGEIDNYDYTFTHKDGGNAHAIFARIIPASEHLLDDHVMSVGENYTAEAVEIEGFEYGLYVHDSEYDVANCLLMKDMGDRMLRVDISAFEDLPKEAVLNLFNPEGNIDLSSTESSETNRHTSGVDFTLVPEGEYWIARWKPDERFIEGRRNDAELADFAEIARLTADMKLPVPAVPEGWSIGYIYSMPSVEDMYYEEVTADNDYILYKYRLQEVAEGQLNHYRFRLDGSDEMYISGEVFVAAELEAMSEWMSDFTYADAIDFPGFEEARFVEASNKDDDNEYLLTVPGNGAYVYIRTSVDVPAEIVLNLLPAE